MLPPQDVTIYLNNALKPTHTLAELDRDASLPPSVAEMPDQVSGRFVSLDTPAEGAGAFACQLRLPVFRLRVLGAIHVLHVPYIQTDRVAGLHE